MQIEELIASSYVFTESGNECTLEYYICSDQERDDTRWGIKIRKACLWGETTELRTYPGNRISALNTVLRFARNFVFPETLGDIIDDMLA